MAKRRTCPSPSRRATAGQVASMDKRMAALALKDPRYADLFDILLSAGGEYVAAWEEPDLEEILERGYLRSGRGARKAPGRPISCHENAAYLWHDNPEWAVIVTGWALSKDGVWRQHSWVKNAIDGHLYETTEPRVLYYGVDLDERESQRFYEGNALHMR